MGEKLAQLGLMPGEVRDLNIGSSFRENSTFHTIRYDFKPASVDPSQMGVLTVGGDSNNSVSVNVPHMNGTGVTHFGGHAKESNKRECILIYDAETGEFTLEKISSQILLKKTRPEKGAPPENNLAQQPTPPTTSHHSALSSNPHTSSSSFKQQSKKTHSNHRSKPISPAHRNASPSSRPPQPSKIQGSQYKKTEDFSSDLDDEFDIMKSLQPVKTSLSSPRDNRSNVGNSSSSSSSAAAVTSTSSYRSHQQQPPPEKKLPSPQTQASTGDSSDSSSSDSSSGSGSDGDDEDFQEVVSTESKGNNGSTAAPSMPSFSTSPNPHQHHHHSLKEKSSMMPSRMSGSSSMKAILNDDLQLSSESDDDSD